MLAIKMLGMSGMLIGNGSSAVLLLYLSAIRNCGITTVNTELILLIQSFLLLNLSASAA